MFACFSQECCFSCSSTFVLWERSYMASMIPNCCLCWEWPVYGPSYTCSTRMLAIVLQIHVSTYAWPVDSVDTGVIAEPLSLYDIANIAQQVEAQHRAWFGL